MEKIITERVVYCPICGNRLFNTSVDAYIFLNEVGAISNYIQLNDIINRLEKEV